MVTTATALIDRLSQAAGVLAALSLVAMAALMLAEIALRSFLDMGLTFSWEYTSYLMGLVFFFGAGYTLRTGGHVRVSILAEQLPARPAYLLDVACTVFGLWIAGYLAYALVGLAYQSYTREVLSFTPTQTPLIIPQGLLALGACLLVLQMTARLVRLLAGAEADAPAPAQDLRSKI